MRIAGVGELKVAEWSTVVATSDEVGKEVHLMQQEFAQQWRAKASRATVAEVRPCSSVATSPDDAMKKQVMQNASRVSEKPVVLEAK